MAYYLGVAYFKKNDWVAAKEEMLNFIDQIAADNEFQPDAHYILGLSYFNLKKYDEAIKIFYKIKKHYPKKVSLAQDAEINIARSLYEKGDVKKALKEFKIIIYKYPKTEIALQSMSWLAEYYLQTFDLSNAIDYYTRIITDFPGSPKKGEAVLGLGKAYYQKEEYDKALNQFKLINSSFNEELYAEARLLIAETFGKQLNPQTSIQAYQNIIENSPEFTRDAYVKIAKIYQKEKKYKKSLTAYKKALESSKGLNRIKKSEIQFYIGDLNEILNNQKNAVEEYLKISYLYPEDTKWVIKAFLRIARIFENQEDWENAKIIYEKIAAYEIEERTFAQEKLDWINGYLLTK